MTFEFAVLLATAMTHSAEVKNGILESIGTHGWEVFVRELTDRLMNTPDCTRPGVEELVKKLTAYQWG